jgi:hypothetical protein
MEDEKNGQFDPGSVEDLFECAHLIQVVATKKNYVISIVDCLKIAAVFLNTEYVTDQLDNIANNV